MLSFTSLMPTANALPAGYVPVIQARWSTHTDFFLTKSGVYYTDPAVACAVEELYWEARRPVGYFNYYNGFTTLGPRGNWMCVATLYQPVSGFITPNTAIREFWIYDTSICPTHSTFYLTAPTAPVSAGVCLCHPGYAPDGNVTRCVIKCPTGQQPDAAGTTCVAPTACPVGQKSHPYGGCMLACPASQHPNLADTACVADDACTVAHPMPLPIAASDPCTAALESKATQAVVDKLCGIPSTNMQKEVACLTEKLAANGITISINNKVRSEAYQAHFWDVWSKMKDVMADKIQNDPVKKAACAARQAELAKEKGCNRAGPCTKPGKTSGSKPVPDCTLGGHCFASRPSQNPKSAHSDRRAIDMSGLQVNALQAILNGRSPPETIASFLAAPGKTGTVCPATPQLKWGGTFPGNPDRVHFFLDKP